MNEVELRAKCLQLAISAGCAGAKIAERAEEFYEFALAQKLQPMAEKISLLMAELIDAKAHNESQRARDVAAYQAVARRKKKPSRRTRKGRKK